MALALKIAGTDRIANLERDTLTVEQDASTYMATAEFVLADTASALTITPKDSIYIYDGSEVYFYGSVSDTNTVNYTKNNATARRITVRCQDAHLELEKRIVESATYAAGDYTDVEIITDLFDIYYASGIDYATYMAGAPLVAAMEEITFEGVSLRQALSTICGRSGGKFYVHYDGTTLYFHYFATETNAAAFGLSNTPNGSTTFGYEELEQKLDATQLCNAFYIVGQDDAAWVISQASIDIYGRHEATVNDTTLLSPDALTERGTALLAQYANPRTVYSVVTDHGAGLRAGMQITLVWSTKAINASFNINRVRIYHRNGTLMYKLELGDVAPDFTSQGRNIGDVVQEVTNRVTVIEGGVFDVDAPAAPDLQTANMTSGVALDADGHQVVYIDITWGSVADTDLDYYDVNLSTSSDFSSYIMSRQHPAGGTRIERFIGLLGNTAYYGRVRAVDWVGNASAWSTTRTHTTAKDTTAPGQTVGLTAAGARTLIGLTWTASTATDLAYYDVQWCATSGGTYASLGTAKLTYFIDRTFTEVQIQAETTRYYKVRAYDTSGNAGDFSTVASASVSPLGEDSLAADSIVAGKIAADAVTAECIDVIDLSAINADLGTITAGTVTGATIRTAASGTRVQMDSSNGLIVYGTAGAVVFQAATTGAGQIGTTGLNPIIWNALGQLNKLDVNQITVGPGGNNLMTNTAFIVDDNADNIPDDWTEGHTATHYSHADYTADSVFGGHSHYMDLSSTNVDETYCAIYQAVVMATMGLAIGDDFVLSGYIKTASMSNCRAILYVSWVDAGESLLQTDTAATITTNVAWTRYSVTNTIPATATKCYVYCMFQASATNGTGNSLFDCIQLERGDLVTQWRPGLYGNVKIDATRILITDGTDKIFLGKSGSDFGMFGYDGATLQTAWYAAGTNAGKIVAGAGAVTLGALGLTIDNGADANNRINWAKSGTIFAYAQSIYSVADTDSVSSIQLGVNEGDLAGTNAGQMYFYVYQSDGITPSAALTFGSYLDAKLQLPAGKAFTFDMSDTVYIADTANANMTLGLTINQAANDDEILAFKNSDVDHTITTIAETDTYGFFQKCEAAAGGLAITGMKDSGGVAGAALDLKGWIDEAADTTKSTSGIGIVRIIAGIADGTGVQAAGADANLLTIANYSTTRFLFDAEGSAHGDVEFVAFDDYDDVALLDKLQRTTIAAQFGDWADANRRELEALNIAHFDETPGHAMINFSRLSMLLTGACKQLGQRVSQLESKLLEAGYD